MNSESSTGPPGKPLSVVIAGGGTGGHISPAVAVANELRRRGSVELHWIGSHTGFEREAAEQNDIPFYPVRTGKLRRYFSLATLADVARVPAGVVEARRILKRIQPEVIFSTGGFVSTPAVMAGRLCGIPLLTHEQTAGLGLATRINARFCDVVALSFPGDGTLRTRRSARVIVTGNPVRPSVMKGDRGVLHSLYDMPRDLPLIYVTGGAQGAKAINRVVAEALPELLEEAVVIHQCGPQSGNGDYARLAELRESLDQPARDRYFPVERVGDELGHVYAAAAVVVGRAGAGTVAELAAIGVPSILIPLPGADEQMRNARVLEQAGGAKILPQTELTPDRLLDTIRSIVTDEALYDHMRTSARSVTAEDPASRICDALISLAHRS